MTLPPTPAPHPMDAEKNNTPPQPVVPPSRGERSLAKRHLPRGRRMIYSDDEEEVPPGPVPSPREEETREDGMDRRMMEFRESILREVDSVLSAFSEKLAPGLGRRESAVGAQTNAPIPSLGERVDGRLVPGDAGKERRKEKGKPLALPSLGVGQAVATVAAPQGGGRREARKRRKRQYRHRRSLIHRGANCRDPDKPGPGGPETVD